MGQAKPARYYGKIVHGAINYLAKQQQVKRNREKDSAVRKKPVPAKGRFGQSVEWCPKVASGLREQVSSTQCR